MALNWISILLFEFQSIRWKVIFSDKRNWVLLSSYARKLIPQLFVWSVGLFPPLAHEMESICRPCCNHVLHQQFLLVAKSEGSSLPGTLCKSLQWSPQGSHLDSKPAWAWGQLSLTFQNVLKQAEICETYFVKDLNADKACGAKSYGGGGFRDGGFSLLPQPGKKSGGGERPYTKKRKAEVPKARPHEFRARLWLSAVATGREALRILRQVVQALFQMLLPKSAHLDFEKHVSGRLGGAVG